MDLSHIYLAVSELVSEQVSEPVSEPVTQMAVELINNRLIFVQ